MQYPTKENIADWDGSSLTAVLWEQTSNRLHKQGLGSLNHAEQVIHVLMNFDVQFNNGGCGQWLDQCPGEELRVTPEFLREIDAVGMAEFVEDVYTIAGDAITELEEDLRQHNLAQLPDAFHESIEDLTGRFLEFEPQFLDFLYGFARRNWQKVQTV
jgi:Domain of unknown function (DUF4375)